MRPSPITVGRGCGHAVGLLIWAAEARLVFRHPTPAAQDRQPPVNLVLDVMQHLLSIPSLGLIWEGGPGEIDACPPLGQLLHLHRLANDI
ncbi:hypothetical protein CDEST_07951 [Colletotrichum destructivum]|uniref:Uncharacterized protein n=1 Tax=Colletotrichum destructivum TaxID=34406 RepID=A0AAX4II26_9PEZI|nr:hypothetical protein CDEST_07951 [Colletotrichum destructivum]